MSLQMLIKRCNRPESQPVLRAGDSGPDVQALQRLLAEGNRGFDIGLIYNSGNDFGPALESIVNSFQQQVFLTVDGVVGPKTWKALCVDGPIDMPVIRRGDQGTTVQLAQNRLAKSGYYNAAIDGDFGPVTDAAVKRLQTDYQLTVDGVIGPVTWDTLSRL